MHVLDRLPRETVEDAMEVSRVFTFWFVIGCQLIRMHSTFFAIARRCSMQTAAAKFAWSVSYALCGELQTKVQWTTHKMQ